MAARLPVDLLDALDAEARRRGVSTEALVDELLVTTLPVVLAEAAEARLRHSLTLSHDMKRPRLVGRGQLPNIKATADGTAQGSTT
jgi:hypothetical protein